MPKLIQTLVFSMKKRKLLIHNSKGFTLVEVLIGISILSLIMLAIVNFSSETMDVANRVPREDRENLQVETAMARFEWDFSQIYSPLYFSHMLEPEKMSELEGEAYNRIISQYQSNSRYNAISFDGLPVPTYKNPEKSSLVFFTNSNRRRFANDKQSQFAWVKYELVKDDDEIDDAEEIEEKRKLNAQNKIVRSVITSNIYSPRELDWSEVKQQTLLRGVIKLLFEFYNPENNKWTDNLELIKNGYQKISAIRVTLDYLDGSNAETQTVRIFRPLFPEFTPEDMYKFLNAKSKPNTAEGSRDGEEGGSGEGNGNTQNSNGENTENPPADDDDDDDDGGGNN